MNELTTDPEGLAGRIESSRSAAREGSLFEEIRDAEVARSPRGQAFGTMQLDLADTTPQRWEGLVYGVHYRRQGSAPGGRVDVRLSNGVFMALYPGSRVVGLCNGVQVARAASSSTKGKAELIFLLHRDANFFEPDDVPGHDLAGVDLLGDSLTSTYVEVPENTVPTGEAPTGSFEATGWNRLRVLLSGTALESASLTPWIREPVTGLWFPQTETAAVITVPDTAASAYDRRVLSVECEGAGKMFFEVRSLLPAGLTTLGMIVQGIK